MGSRDSATHKLCLPLRQHISHTPQDSRPLGVATATDAGVVPAPVAAAVSGADAVSGAVPAPVADVDVAVAADVGAGSVGGSDVVSAMVTVKGPAWASYADMQHPCNCDICT